MKGPTVLLYGSRRPLDQFAGVPERLADRGAEVLYERLWDHGMRTGLHAQPELIRRAGVIGFADLSYNMHLRATRIARRHRVPTVLVVDGVTEFATTYLNPWMGLRHLRPAPADLVLALGPLQAKILTAMGNAAVRRAGLPRLDGVAERVETARGRTPARSWLVVATAWTPALSEAAGHRLLAMLEHLRAATEERRMPVRWRLTGGLAERLGVPADRADLAESLAGASAVITTASTLAVESMLAGVPTAIAHPHPWPLWVPGAWEWRPDPADRSDAEQVSRSVDASGAVRRAADEALAGVLGGFDPRLPDAGSLLDALEHPEPARLACQRRLLREMHTPDAAHEVADALLGMTRDPPAAEARAAGDIERIGHTLVRAGVKRRRRALSLLQCGRSPVHGVTNWSVRMSRAFAERADLGWEFHTLLVGSEPTNFERFNTPEIGDEPHLHRCVLDPLAGTHERMEALLRAAEAVDADVIVPSHGEEVLAVAARLRAGGARCLGIAHVDETAEFGRLADFGGWDGLVGVSRACVEGIARAIPGSVPHRIVYGVPLAATPRRSDRSGPIRLGYVGRMVEGQKRIGELIGLIARLGELGVDHEFHIVGDGPDLNAWTARARDAGITGDRLVMHGRRSMEWVEAFLPTLDLSVNVSGWEGTSVSMLEAMGRGVVPCVTGVASGVDEWIEDGVHGIVTPVGRPDLMAKRIADVAADRDRIDRMGAAAHARMCERGMGLSHAAERYAAVLDDVLAAPRARPAPSDRGVRLRDRSEWSPAMPDDDAEADRWVRDALGACGFRSIAVGAPAPGCDAVLIPARSPRPDPGRVEAWRRAGLGVGISPNLCVERGVLLAESALRRLVGAGCRRIAVFGAGTQSSSFGPAVRRGEPIVGWIDDAAAAFGTHMGLPAVPAEHALAVLKPDGVVLNSQRFEPLLAERAAGLGLGRAAALTRDDATLTACVEALRSARSMVGRGRRVIAVCEADTRAYAAAVGLDTSVSPGDLPGLVRSAGPPDAVLLALEGDEAGPRAALVPWAERGVEIFSCLRAGPSGGAVAGQIEQPAGEAVEAEAVAASPGDGG